MLPSLNQLIKDIPEASSIHINQMVANKKQQGERVYIFSSGEAFFDIPRFEISDDEFVSGYHYSNSMGNSILRQKISDLYKSNCRVASNPNSEILISAGSKIVIFMLLQALLSFGDEVVIPEPAWLSYKEQVKIAGGIVKSIPFYKTLTEWEKYISPKTKVLIINTPNNPSGKLYSEEELRFLLMLAEKYNFFILSDEAYSDFLLPEDKFISISSFDKTKEHVVIVNSLSKNMGMSGWRVGYTIANAEIVKQLLKLNQHLVTCGSTLLQNYIAKHFEKILAHTVPQAQQIAQKRKEVQKIIDNIGMRVLPGVGTFYFFIDVSNFKGTTEELVCELLTKYNIATVPGGAYGNSTKGFIRFGIGIENLADIGKCLKIICNLAK